MIWHQSMGHKGPVLRPRCIETKKAKTQLLLYSLRATTVSHKGVTFVVTYFKVTLSQCTLFYHPFLFTLFTHNIKFNLILICYNECAMD